VQARTSEIQQLAKALESAGIKRPPVLVDVNGYESQIRSA
jgi:hypothetical protein